MHPGIGLGQALRNHIAEKALGACRDGGNVRKDVGRLYLVNHRVNMTANGLAKSRPPGRGMHSIREQDPIGGCFFKPTIEESKRNQGDRS